MTLDEAIRKLEEELGIDPSDRADRAGRNVAHLQD